MSHNKSLEVPIPKIGKIYFTASIDEDTCKITVYEWHVVRHSKKRRQKLDVFLGLPARLAIVAYRKDEFTWVKLSTKHFDWGWAKNIPTSDKKSWTAGTKPNGLHTTRRAALLDEQDTVKKGYVSDDPIKNKKMLAAIKRAIAKCKLCKP